MRVNPDAFSDFIASPFADRRRIWSALARSVDTPPLYGCVLPAANGGQTFLLGDSYLAWVEQSADSTTTQVRLLDDVVKVDVELSSDLAVAYMMGDPKGSVIETLTGTNLRVRWVDGDEWDLGGAVWAGAFRGGAEDPVRALDLIWALVESSSSSIVEIDWPTR